MARSQRPWRREKAAPGTSRVDLKTDGWGYTQGHQEHQRPDTQEKNPETRLGHGGENST